MKRFVACVLSWVVLGVGVGCGDEDPPVVGKTTDTTHSPPPPIIAGTNNDKDKDEEPAEEEPDDPNAIPLALALASQKPSSPMDVSAFTFTALVSGFESRTDAEKVSLKIAPVNGLTMLPKGTVEGNTKRFNVTIQYDDPAKVGCGEVNISVTLDTLPEGYKYRSGAVTIPIPLVIHGATRACRIEVDSSNIEDFNKYANTPNGAKLHYVLMEDVELTTPPLGQSNWTPIGIQSNASGSYALTGSFDGNGFTISNLVIAGSGIARGMFGRIAGDAVIENLGLTELNVKGTQDIGGLVGQKTAGTVRNCHVTGNVSGASSSVGGLVGINELGTVENSYVEVTVSNTHSYTGGLVGSNFGLVRNCYATGSVTGTGASSTYVGGVVGSNSGTVKDCYSTGDVKSINDSVGGVVGYNLTAGKVENCYATGKVVNNSGNNSIQTGGIVGSVYASEVRNCVALNPSVTSRMSSSQASSYTGRIVGQNSQTFVNNHARDDMNIRYAVIEGSSPGTEKNFNISGPTNVAHRMDGADVAADEYGTQLFWETTMGWSFSETGAWKWNSDTQLPILRRVGGDQNHEVQLSR